MNRRILALLPLLLLAVSVMAQSPMALRKAIAENPNLSVPTFSTYPPAPLAEVAKAPKGFKPFYISHFGRHGSRYDIGPKSQKRIVKLLEKADSLKLLSEKGQQALAYAKEILNKQTGNNEELSALGAKQLREMGVRTATNFHEVFERGGVVNARSSSIQRCLDSRDNFTQSLSKAYPSLTIENSSTKEDMRIMRPGLYTDEMSANHHNYAVKGEWRGWLKVWADRQDCAYAIKRISPDATQFLKKMGVHPFHFMKDLFRVLQFALNFEVGSEEFISSIFSDEDRYKMYIYTTYPIVSYYGGVGHPIMDVREACMRPLIEDIISHADKAVSEESPKTVAHLRFSHDTYFSPLIVAIGYDGCEPKIMRDVELSTTSVNYSMMVPMAASLQLVFYRNKRGEVLVRSLLNERDVTLPIASATAPFYRWEDMRTYLQQRMDMFDKKAGLKK